MEVNILISSYVSSSITALWGNFTQEEIQFSIKYFQCYRLKTLSITIVLNYGLMLSQKVKSNVLSIPSDIYSKALVYYTLDCVFMVVGK